MRQKFLNKLQEASDQNLVDIEQAKAEGRQVVGFYCLYSPMEIAIAADCIPLPLCGTRNDPVHEAEKTLPRNLCPLIKSSFGFAASDTCPFFRFADAIIGDTTCDGKKKMFELLSRYKETHVLQLPQNQDSATALPPWRAELDRFKTIIEARSGVSINNRQLRAAISLMNQVRAAKQALMDVNKLKPAPLGGVQLLEIMFKVGFLADKRKSVSLMREAARLAKDGIFRREEAAPAERKRILLTGVPVGMGSEKVVRIVEQSGADVVALENCSGYKQAFHVDDQADPMDALAAQYLSTPCSVMSPNQGRLALLKEMIQAFQADGVIDLTWQACHTYNVEAFTVAEFVRESFGVPTLHLETDYAEGDAEQLRVRIEAYLEIV